MEEELEEESTLLSYCPLHDEFWEAASGPLPKPEEELPLYITDTYKSFLYELKKQTPLDLLRFMMDLLTIIQLF